MKLNIKNMIYVTAMSGSLIFASSCDKVDFGDTNVNPNATTEPITSALLTQALSSIGATSWGDGLSSIAGYYSQFYTETQYTETSRYAKLTANWDGLYAGYLYDLQNIINYNSDPATAEKAVLNGSNANQIATARIAKAYFFWQITDLWGDIPYFEALKGGQGRIPYDPQEAIYADLMKELREAVDQFDNGLAVKGDILFSGNIAAWKRFANSIRLQMALQISKGDANLGKTEFVSALSHPAGVIDDNSENAALAYPGGNYLNPFNSYYNVTKRDDFGVTSSILDRMNGNGDLRNSKVASSTVGFPYGLTRDAAVAFSNSNTNFARPMAAGNTPSTASVPVVTAAHVYLARAEAAQLGWTSENVEEMYEAGIAASWAEFGINNPGSLANYLADADINLGSGSVPEKIAIQRWFAYYPNGWKAWNITRKNGFPALAPAPGLASIPVRFNYGTNEPQLNPENYAAAAAKFSANGEENSMYAPVWWDK